MNEPKRFEERELYRRFRYRMIRRAKSRCELCEDKKPLSLVYLKDLSVFSELALSPDNAKIICQKCLSNEWAGSSLGGFSTFYDRLEWKHTRKRVLSDLGSTCRLCHCTPTNPSNTHVDHIKPRYIYPELSFTLGNLQPLCADCNIGKGASVFENTVASSLVNQHLAKVQARAKAIEGRYLEGIRSHITNGPKIDSLIRYIDFRHEAKAAFVHPTKLQHLLARADREIKLLETSVGETFELFGGLM